MAGDVDFWTPMPSRVLVCAVLLATAATGCGRTASSTNEAASAAVLRRLVRHVCPGLAAGRSANGHTHPVLLR